MRNKKGAFAHIKPDIRGYASTLIEIKLDRKKNDICDLQDLLLIFLKKERKKSG